VIHGCHHEQDMRKMGGLSSRMPVTTITFAIGVAAIAGVPFLSGFYSKDAILSGAWHRFPLLAAVGLASALLTAFYMFRLFAMTFLGTPRSEHAEHAHESPPAMTVPLVVLALLSVIAGWGAWHSTLLDPADVAARISTPAGGRAVGSIHGHEHSGTVMVLAITAGLLGLGLGFLAFVKRVPALWAVKRPFAGLERAFARKFWFDELYREAFLRPAYLVASFFAWADGAGVDGAVNAVGRGGQRTSRVSGAVDHVAVDGLVRAVGGGVLAGGGGLARVQSGRIRLYIGIGVAAVAAALVLVYVIGS
jgi:NADH-quinone oxidoreductase subunit L